MPIFCVRSVKIYTGQVFFTQTPSVVSVTNIRYGLAPKLVPNYYLKIYTSKKVQCFLFLQYVFGIWFYRYRYNAESANQPVSLPQSTGFTSSLVIFIHLIFQARPYGYFDLSHILGQTFWLFLSFSYFRPDLLAVYRLTLRTNWDEVSFPRQVNFSAISTNFPKNVCNHF